MSFEFQNIKYGWVALAGVAITGVTIFVADNLRHQVKQVDAIEVVLATHERCLATQYGTNELGEPLYYVAPPSFVRDWQSSTGIETVTNAIGWNLDLDMLIDLDEIIVALVPNYEDLNNLGQPYTVTGLWAYLEIGDKTNLFTRTPEIPGSGGVTNAATYGGYLRQVYEQNLVERYKVLYSLQRPYSPATVGITCTNVIVLAKDVQTQTMWPWSQARTNLEVAISEQISAFNAQEPFSSIFYPPMCVSSIFGWLNGGQSWYGAGFQSAQHTLFIKCEEFDNTYIPWVGKRVDWVEIRNIAPNNDPLYEIVDPPSTNWTPVAQYDMPAGSEDAEHVLVLGTLDRMDSGTAPTLIEGVGKTSYRGYKLQWRLRSTHDDINVDSGFCYATNKYW